MLHRICKAKWLLILPLFIVLIGCSSIGTVLLPKNREGFNGAMISSEEQQLLLNLVRATFEDRPYFMSVDNITTSNSLSLNGGPSYSNAPSSSTSTSKSFDSIGQAIAFTNTTLSESYSLSTSWSGSPSLSYSDSPTVSFTPLQGESFSRQMLTPIDLPTLALLLNSPWGFGRIMRISTEWLGNNKNPSMMHGHVIPNPKKFIELVDLLWELQQENMIYFDLGEITEVEVT